MYFEKAGKENTEKSLRIAKEEALKRNIKYIVVASTTGETGLKMAEILKDTEIKLVVVTHNTGFSKEGEVEFKEENKKKIEELGGIVYTGTMVLRNLGCAIRNKFQYSEQEIVNSTLRMFCQGIKVCVEIVAMAADAGLICFDDVIAVAGTGRGADTVCVIKANSSNRFFDIKIREILAKPRDF
jgi:hypothetical protein